MDGPVALYCLGRFDLRIPGRELDWSRLRPRAVSALRLLAAHAQEPVHRERLLLLWPDTPPDAARHSLQVAVSAVRGFLVPDERRGDRMIRRIGDSYQLVLPEGSTSDIVRFQAAITDATGARRSGDPAAERAALTVAMDCYAGDLLPGDGPAEWVVALRDRLRLDAATTAERLAELELAAGDPRAAAATARRGVQLDPYRDACRRLLIAAYHRGGEPAAAARARREYHAMLESLGVRISPPRIRRPYLQLDG